MEKDGSEKEKEKRIEETVLEILKDADMESVTEHKIRAMAAEKLELDLSVPHRKKIVRKVVESFLLSQQNEDVDNNKKEEEEEEKPQEEDDEEKHQEGDEDEDEGKKKNYGVDDNGDLILCNLTNKRRVTLQEFKGKTLVSIREFYEKDGKQLPTSKGISLTVEQWGTFRKAVPDIEDAIKKFQGV